MTAARGFALGLRRGIACCSEGQDVPSAFRKRMLEGQQQQERRSGLFSSLCR